MKHALAILAAVFSITATAAPVPQATHLWTTNKINEIVGTNTAAKIASATNATLTAAKSYTDAAIQGVGGLTPQDATNTAQYVVRRGIDTNLVAAATMPPWLTTSEGRAPGQIGTVVEYYYNRKNYQWGVDFAKMAVHAKETEAADKSYQLGTPGGYGPFLWTLEFDGNVFTDNGGRLVANKRNPTSGAIESTKTNAWMSDVEQIAANVSTLQTQYNNLAAHKQNIIQIHTAAEMAADDRTYDDVVQYLGTTTSAFHYGYFYKMKTRSPRVWENVKVMPADELPNNAAVLTNGGTLETVSGTAIGPTAVGALSPSTAAATYYPKAQGDAWSSYWDGDDVRVTVTNYDSVANIPSLYLEQRTNQTAQATNAFKIVWREMAHWERFLGTNWNWNAQWDGFKTWAANISAQIAQKADRAWGYFDSHTGNYAPAGYTSISSANVMLCKDASYQKTLTTAGEVWVLTANDPYEPTGVSTNGGFQIKDHEGNVQFEIVKGDKVTVKAQANAVTVENGTTLVVTYNIIAGSHPTGEVCLDLANPTWKSETAADCPATVVWSGTSGNYVARITPTGAAATKCFFKATYQRGGDTYINNRCAVGMSQIVLNGTTYNLGTATISGSTVLTLTPAN